MIDQSAVTLRLWGRRASRFVHWIGIRDRHDRLAMWHLDRLAEALTAEGWRIRRRFDVAPVTLGIGATEHAPATVELTATHFGRWIYLARGYDPPIPCADLTAAVAEIENLIWQRFTQTGQKRPRHEQPR